MYRIDIHHAENPAIVGLLKHVGLDAPPWDSASSVAWLAQTADGKVVGAAIAERGDRSHESIWRLRRLGVLPDARRKGIGATLCEQVENAARQEGALALTAGTYAYWQGMRVMLRGRGWALEEYRRGNHQDNIEEQWILPLREKPLRVVVVGANPKGRGGELIEAIRDLEVYEYIQLAGVCDTDCEVLNGWRSEQVACHSDLALLLDQVQPDAAVLVLPHREYRKMRHVLLERRLGFLQEKPLACDLREVLELQNLLNHAPLPLVVGVQRRSHPSYLYLQQHLDRRQVRTIHIHIALGRPHDSDPSPNNHGSGVENPRNWRSSLHIAGGGALIDLGYHAIDLAHFLLNAPLDVLACNLWTQGHPTCDSDIDDAVTIVGRCDHIWVRIHVDRHGMKKEMVVVEGILPAHGSVQNIKTDCWYADRQVVKHNDQIVYQCKDDWALAIRGRLAKLVLACSAPKHSPTDLWDHLAGLRVIEHARLSSVVQGLTSTSIHTLPAAGHTRSYSGDAADTRVN